MFEQTSSAFGAYEQIHIANADGATAISLVPECGACLLGVELKGRQVLDGYKRPEDLDQHRGYKNEWLFPFPNRLKSGSYTFGGQEYVFPINDPETGNALHGISAGKKFKLTRLSLKAKSTMIRCVHKYEGDDKAYPFPFRVILTYEIHTNGWFRATIQVENTGDGPMLLGLGWHPYFKLGSSLAECSLHLPDCQRIEIDEAMIPIGKLSTYPHFSQPQSLDDIQLDHCFLLNMSEPSEVGRVEFKSAMERLRYWQETGPGKFNYLQLFTPPNRQSLAIEPMTCNIDAFNNGDGLMVLQAGEQAGGQFGFSYRTD